jgi:hypothetical protein
MPPRGSNTWLARALPLVLSLSFAWAPALGCAARATRVTFVSPDGTLVAPADLRAAADYTVFVFAARSCPCLRAHDARIRELAAAFAPKGVQFVGVFSEVGETAASIAAERARRGYAFPVVVDQGAVFAEEVSAEYATYVVVMNRAGHVLYRGGLDSDKQRLHDDASMYLRDVLTDVTEGRAPRLAEGKALGCVLRRF